jgi:putative membrane protein
MAMEKGNLENVAKGVVAGVVGGLAGTWAMSHFQGWWSVASHGAEPASAAGRHDARDWQEFAEGQNANEIAAQTIASHTITRPLTSDELSVGAAAVHYTFGAVMGGLYGGLWEISPRIRQVGGAGFGTAVWAAADEIAVPLLGLSGPTTEHPPERHAHAFASHIVFGVTTELVRRGVRAMLNGHRLKDRRRA